MTRTYHGYHCKCAFCRINKLVDCKISYIINGDQIRKKRLEYYYKTKRNMPWTERRKIRLGLA